MKSGEGASEFDWVENLQQKQGLPVEVGLHEYHSDVFLKSLLGCLVSTEDKQTPCST